MTNKKYENTNDNKKYEDTDDNKKYEDTDGHKKYEDTYDNKKYEDTYGNKKYEDTDDNKKCKDTDDNKKCKDTDDNKKCKDTNDNKKCKDTDDNKEYEYTDDNINYSCYADNTTSDNSDNSDNNDNSYKKNDNSKANYKKSHKKSHKKSYTSNNNSNILRYNNKWKSDRYYLKNTLVKHNNTLYICLRTHKNEKPSKYSPKYWDSFICQKSDDRNLLLRDANNNNINKKNDANINYIGKWEGDLHYIKGDIIRHGCSSYIAINDSINREPKDGCVYWGLLAKDGINHEKIVTYEKCDNCRNSDNYNSSDNNNNRAPILHAIFNKCIIYNANNRDKRMADLKDHNCANNEIVHEIKFNVHHYNNDHYKINQNKHNTSTINIKKKGYYRITYNIVYKSPEDFTIFTYLGDDNLISAGELMCKRSNNFAIINHTFYMHINKIDYDRSVKLFYINQNNNNKLENGVTMNNKCWLVIEYIGK